MEERSHTRTEATPVGTAFFNEKYPVKWDLNFLRVERPATYEEIKEACDRSLGGAGLGHRKVHVYNSDLGKELNADFKREGWRADQLLVMVLTGQPRKVGPLNAAEIGREELIPEWMSADLEANPQLTEQEARMLAESSEVTAASIETHFIATRIAGEVAGWCELYLEDGMAQIENVGTHERFRRKGVSTSVVTHAISLSKRAGADLIFLVADDNDWPKDYYARLGFEPAGIFFEFVIPASKD